MLVDSNWQRGSVVLRGIEIDLASDIGCGFIVDCCRFCEALLGEAEIKLKYGLTDSDWAHATRGACPLWGWGQHFCRARETVAGRPTLSPPPRHAWLGLSHLSHVSAARVTARMPIVIGVVTRVTRVTPVTGMRPLQNGSGGLAKFELRRMFSAKRGAIGCSLPAPTAPVNQNPCACRYDRSPAKLSPQSGPGSSPPLALRQRLNAPSERYLN